MSGARARTPGTPTKVRTRREQLAYDEIPTRDISKSKSVGGTPKTRRFIQNSAQNTAVRRSCPEFSNVRKRENHFRRHSENRAYVVKPVARSNEAVNRRSLSQGNLVKPNVTNNSIISSDVSSGSSSKTSTLSRNIYKMWKNGQLCDVIITAGGMQFHVHRLVMAASCEHFATPKQTIYQYDVPNVSAEVMDEVLDFFYTSKLNITSDNIEEVLEISQNLGVKKLLDMCIEFLMKINLNNAVMNRAVAQRHGLNGVISAVDKYVHEHFSTLVTTSSFLESDFNYIYDIISSDILTEPNELKIFHACAQWIDYKRNRRIKYAVPLISLIRFGLIPASEIVAQVEPVTFIFEIPECKDILYNAFRHHALFEESKSSSRVSLAAKCGSRISQNLPRANASLTGKIIKEAEVEQDTETSESAGSSCSATSMEYEVQNFHSEEWLPRAQQSWRGDSKSKVYSEINASLTRSKTSDAAHNEPTNTQTTRDSSNINSTSRTNNRKAEAERTQSVKRLSEKFSNIAVNNKKISRNDLANCKDFFDHTDKPSENKHSKSRTEVKSYDNIHENDQTQENYGHGVNRVSSITNRFPKAQQKETVLSCRSLPNSKKTVSSDQIQTPDDQMDRRNNSPAALKRRFRSLETIPGCKAGHQVTGNFIELSPVRSQPASDLPPPPMPQVIMVVGGVSAYDNDSYNDCVNNCVQQFDPDLNTWSLRSRLPVPVHYSGVALLDGCLYVIGGQLPKDHGFVPIKDCYRYDVVNDKWERTASLRTARCRHATVTLNRTIYVIGGEDCIGMSCKTMETYDPISNSWGFAGPMHEARVGAAAAAHRGRLFVAGGMMDVDEKLTLNTMEVYDPRTHEWTFRYPLPVAVCGSSMVEIADVLYLVGGFVIRDGEPLSLDSIFRYIDETNSWEGYKALHVPRHDAVTAALDSKLYIIGGESSAAMGHALSNVECIDTVTDKHVSGIAPLLTPSYGISGCILSN
ncbi:uncharacterized protein LOC123532063 [Mercenaria mercenaria]|uniref:uncharacterized protein LOC123532063 n=1 Tax=Mercenaria mercenaria TaxID=6596 RepID=UPI00234F3492|nr:uncharacterized protein LOC123532063 [Mercenaria mercenaria]